MSNNSTEQELFWMFQEEDINNEDIFLPSDTPVGKVNLKKQHTLLTLRHNNQRLNLLKSQINDLIQYQENFSKENKNDSLVKPKNVICQLINGSDFIQENKGAISELIAMILETFTNNPPVAMDKDSTKENDDVEDDEKKYQEALKNKYKQGLLEISQRHSRQFKKLNEYQQQDFIPIPAEFLSKSKMNDSDHNLNNDQPPVSEKRKKTLDDGTKDQDRDVKKKRKQDINSKSSSPPLNDATATTNIKHNEINPPRTKHTISNEPSLSKLTKRTIPNEPSLHKSNRHNKLHSLSRTNKNSTSYTSKKSHKYWKENYNQEPENNKTATPIQTPSNVDNAQDMPLFTNSNSGGGGSNTSSNHNHNYTVKDFKSNSYYTRKPYSLIDEGSINIRSKPNRVLINGINYGDPKDYDDAINGIPRLNNPITRRMMGGEFYLFHTSEGGVVSSIGPVSKIQPLIQKFFLSS